MRVFLVCRLIDELAAGSGDIEKVQYTLPDGNTVDIGAVARMRAPEILFRPDMIGSEDGGIHEVLCYAIQKSDLDLRKVFYQNIVLSGGSTLFKGESWNVHARNLMISFRLKRIR